MRILYLDIDTLRADHLGCYGYPRNTSPNIDALAKECIRFDNVHASDTPCLPSRTALLTGRFGIHNGVVNHGGIDADPVMGGVDRSFTSRLEVDSFPFRLKRAGLTTVSISSFAQRHSAFHWYAGFAEAYDVGGYGIETADQVYAIAQDWINRRGREDNWFLHVHMWDPHVPYRAPASYGEPFVDEPFPGWLDETVRAQHWKGCGPHSCQEVNGFFPSSETMTRYPRQPGQIPDMKAVRKMFDGYDCGVLMADDYVGRILNQLEDLGVRDDMIVMLSSDHGETLGELNVYGDHLTGDQHVTRLPMLLRWPGITDDSAGTSQQAFHYQIDFSATMLDLLGGEIPPNWDGASFAADLKAGNDVGRDHLVVSQGAWTCQRSVRFDDYIYIDTRHDGYHLYDDVMLFDLANDPHETRNLATVQPDIAGQGANLLGTWYMKMMRNPARGRDPFTNVIAEGGPWHVRGHLPAYLKRLRDTGRGHCAEVLEDKYGDVLRRER